MKHILESQKIYPVAISGYERYRIILYNDKTDKIEVIERGV